MFKVWLKYLSSDRATEEEAEEDAQHALARVASDGGSGLRL